MITYIPLSEIRRIRTSIADRFIMCSVLADVFRLNALSMIMYAGSGHIGSSFSSLDIITWLWTQEMKNPHEQNTEPSDIYFSSKGHDVPALYSLLIGLEKLEFENLFKLRRLGGLPGHPDISTPLMAANTGPLGMGISKARGMAMAKRLQGKRGHIYVLTGDGELQEGQFWESLQPTVNGNFGEITVIVDHNKIQSDTWVEHTSRLGEFEEKLRSFEWETARCDGHDFQAIEHHLSRFESITDRPKILIADTIKGKGVSFMEQIGEDGFYKFHSGAPSAEHYAAGITELVDRINTRLRDAALPPLLLETKESLPRTIPANPQRLVAAYGDELKTLAGTHKNIIALDADLKLDTGLIPYANEYPERYVQCGIAEQDMVSMAGGLALRGMLPVVHSFACFLSTRPNEQIYNNASEKTKIIYAGSLAGLLPAMPGHSHQSVRDISCLGSVPGLSLIEPCDEAETKKSLRWAVEENPHSTYLRLVSIPCEIPYTLPSAYTLHPGRGCTLRDGSDVLIIGYGPILLTEAFHAAEQLLHDHNISVKLINLPWLNTIDSDWLLRETNSYDLIITLDDHYVELGQGQQVSSLLARHRTNNQSIFNLGITRIPECGQHREVLAAHGLDAASIARFIINSRHA